MSELDKGGEINVPPSDPESPLKGISIHLEGRGSLIAASLLREPLNEMVTPSRFGKGLIRTDSQIMADALRKLRRN